MNQLSLRNDRLKLKTAGKRSEMSQNYWMMVHRYPNLKDEVGGSTPNCEISSLLNIKTCQSLLCFGARWSTLCLKIKKLNITDHFRRICRIKPNLMNEKWKMSTYNWLDLQTLESQPIMPKNLPIAGMN